MLAPCTPRRLRISLFTCCVGQALHLELVSGINSSLLLCFKRFSKTFKGADPNSGRPCLQELLVNPKVLSVAEKARGFFE